MVKKKDKKKERKRESIINGRESRSRSIASPVSLHQMRKGPKKKRKKKKRKKKRKEVRVRHKSNVVTDWLNLILLSLSLSLPWLTSFCALGYNWIDLRSGFAPSQVSIKFNEVTTFRTLTGFILYLCLDFCLSHCQVKTVPRDEQWATWLGSR